LRATGSVLPWQAGGHKPRVLSGAPADWLRHRMSSEPFTLRGLAAELADRGVRADYRAVWEFAHREELSFKKTVVAAEQVLDGPINGELFRLHVTKVLVPTREPGAIVVLDNSPPARGIRLLRSVLTKDALVPAAIRAAGACIFFLPPYSPELNPIEQVFSSGTCCERPASEPSKTHGGEQAPSSTTSHPENAKTIYPTQDMLPYKNITLAVKLCRHQVRTSAVGSLRLLIVGGEQRLCLRRLNVVQPGNGQRHSDWGTWIRTKIDGVRVRCSAFELSLKENWPPKHRGASKRKNR
jgi:hypothetical protein